MAKRQLLKLSDEFEGHLRALLATPPAPSGTARESQGGSEASEEGEEEAAETERAEGGCWHLRVRSRASAQGGKRPKRKA